MRTWFITGTSRGLGLELVRQLLDRGDNVAATTRPAGRLDAAVGLTAFGGWGLYCAGKYALEGLTESPAAEVAGFGITVNLVEPGYTRTDFLRAHSLGRPAHPVDGYDAIREMTTAHLAMPGTQLGDPVQVAAAIIQVAGPAGAPLHQLLGSDSYGLARARVDALAADIGAGRDLARSTDIAAT